MICLYCLEECDTNIHNVTGVTAYGGWELTPICKKCSRENLIKIIKDLQKLWGTRA